MRHRLVLAAALLGAAALAPAHAQVRGQEDVQSVLTEAGPVGFFRAASGLVHPWGMAFLPDGRLLVTERPGRLRIVGQDGTVSAPVEGTPEVFATGQGGLLDVALHPDFAENRTVYLTFAQAGEGGASTALGRGRLTEDDRIEGFATIFVQQPKVQGPNHFGSRIVFSPDGHLFLALGERYKFEPAQNLANTLGTVLRLTPDGEAPVDNPFVGDPNAEDAIWSYGHRNIQAAAINPETGSLWVAEMGPLGGDEVNLPRAGANYGWPVVSWGRHYSGEPIPDPSTRPEFADAVKVWVPSIAPSGMIFYTGDVFPEWRGSAFVGALATQELVRVTYEGDRPTGEERIPLGVRIRDVAQGPEGHVYVLTDQQDGNLWRLNPLD